ncbi:MAG: hypothetical protein ACRDBM_11955 [Sporomusa sp.]
MVIQTILSLAIIVAVIWLIASDVPDLWRYANVEDLEDDTREIK